MKTTTLTQRWLPLAQREWLQHRRGWALMYGLPVAIALLGSAFGQIQLGQDLQGPRQEEMPTIVTLICLLGGAALLGIIATISGVVQAGSLARRDHGDRSIEFWLSLPTDQPSALGVPLVVHLLLVPAVALVVGMLGGLLTSAIVVARFDSLGAWLSQPWASVAPAALSLLARVLVGLPLAFLWLLPLITAVALLSAYFKRWAWVILLAGFGVGSFVIKQVFGQRWLVDFVGALLTHAGRSLLAAQSGHLEFGESVTVTNKLSGVHIWAAYDAAAAYANLLTPLLPLALLISAACFWALVRWRAGGAGANSGA